MEVCEGESRTYQSAQQPPLWTGVQGGPLQDCELQVNKPAGLTSGLVYVFAIIINIMIIISCFVGHLGRH